MHSIQGPSTPSRAGRGLAEAFAGVGVQRLGRYGMERGTVALIRSLLRFYPRNCPSKRRVLKLLNVENGSKSC